MGKSESEVSGRSSQTNVGEAKRASSDNASDNGKRVSERQQLTSNPMYYAIFFISGLVVGIFLVFILMPYIRRLDDKKNSTEEETLKPTNCDELEYEILDDKKKASHVKLEEMNYRLDGYIENDVAIISFQLTDMFPELMNKNYEEKSNYPLMDMVKSYFQESKTIQILLMYGCEMKISKLLKEGRVKIYSKIDTELIESIRWTNFIVAENDSTRLEELSFYLPSGRLFLKTKTSTTK